MSDKVLHAVSKSCTPGTSTQGAEVIQERLDLITEIVPRAKCVACLMADPPAGASLTTLLESLNAVAKQRALEVHGIEAGMTGVMVSPTARLYWHAPALAAGGPLGLTIPPTVLVRADRVIE